MSDIVKQIEDLKVVPVVAIQNLDDAERLADALTAGGIACAEITLRTEAGLPAIELLAKRSGFLVGAGTVHNADQAAAVIDAGAKFVVAPGFNPKTVAKCIDKDVPGRREDVEGFSWSVSHHSLYADRRRFDGELKGLSEPAVRDRLWRKLDGQR